MLFLFLFLDFDFPDNLKVNNIILTCKANTCKNFFHIRETELNMFFF